VPRNDRQRHDYLVFDQRSGQKSLAAEHENFAIGRNGSRLQLGFDDGPANFLAQLMVDDLETALADEP
jgi:hypothetical protein